MSSDKHCCVPGCTNSGGKHKVLHGFPNPDKDIERFNTWLNAIGGPIIDLEKYHVYKYRRVCHSHFEQKYLCRNDRISNIAVPTLNMPAPVEQSTVTFAARNPVPQMANTPMLKTYTAPVKKPSVPLSDRDLMLQNTDWPMPSTSTGVRTHQTLGTTSSLIPLKKYAEKENIGVRTHQTLGTTSSFIPPKTFAEKENIGVRTHQTLGTMSSLIPPKKYAEKENIAPGERNTEPATEGELLSLDSLTLKKGSVKEKTDVETKTTVQHSCDQVIDTVKDVQQRKGKYPRKKIRQLHMRHEEKELLGKLTAARIKLSKCRNKIKKQKDEIKAAKQVATHPLFMKALEDSTTTAKIFIQMELRENKKKLKGRRFTMQEKIISLSMLKQSPKAYRNLRKIFTLPAPQTLHKLIENCNLHPGINKNIFRQLKKKAETMKIEEKLCILLYDEVSLKANISYIQSRDKTVGFVDDGERRFLEFADHAQVFMVRGLIKNFKQPVSYTFSASATKGPDLAKQIKNVINELQEAGLTVVATICDQGANNRNAIKILINETKAAFLREGKEPMENIIRINNQEIVPLYDPPHLLKGIRNNFITKNLKYVKEGELRLAKWGHLKLLHHENPEYRGVRLIPKLTLNHVQAEKINKMKVKYASQIFSRTVGSNMGYLADKGILPSECKETADFLLFMDNLFDSVNGSFDKKRKSFAKPLLGPATPNSVHKKTWLESKHILKSIKFINAHGKEESVPSIKNWVWTLDGIQVLLKKLEKEFSISSVWMRHLNQDPLENFFGSIRSHGCRNNNPTCSQFESAFTTLLINNLKSVHSQGKNCEDDYCEALQALVIEKNTEPSSTSGDTYDFENIISFCTTSVEEKTNDPRKIAPLQYMSGYFAKQAKKNIFKGCKECNDHFINKNEMEYIKYREYAGRRWLITPSNEMVQLVSEMQEITNEILKENINEQSLKIVIKTAMVTLISFDFIKCSKHKDVLIDYLINIVFRCFIFNYCKNINHILAGRRDVDDDEDKLQVKAKKYFSKCFKRKK